MHAYIMLVSFRRISIPHHIIPQPPTSDLDLRGSLTTGQEGSAGNVEYARYSTLLERGWDCGMRRGGILNRTG